MIHFQTLQELRESITEINTTHRFLLDYKNALRIRVKVVRARSKNMDVLMKEGKMLDVIIQIFFFFLKINSI